MLHSEDPQVPAACALDEISVERWPAAHEPAGVLSSIRLCLSPVKSVYAQLSMKRASEVLTDSVIYFVHLISTQGVFLSLERFAEVSRLPDVYISCRQISNALRNRIHVSGENYKDRPGTLRKKVLPAFWCTKPRTLGRL